MSREELTKTARRWGEKLASVFLPRAGAAMRPAMTHSGEDEERPAPPTDAPEEMSSKSIASAEAAAQTSPAENAENSVMNGAESSASPLNEDAPSDGDADRIRALFHRAPIDPEGPARFQFARWGKPIAPAFCGLTDESEAVMREGFAAAAALAGLELAEEDPDLGANILVCVVERWSALPRTPGLVALIPDLAGLIVLLEAADRNQHRLVSFEPDGGLRLCVILLRYDDGMARLSGASLALGQALQALLYWSDEAFLCESPVTLRRGGKPIVKPRFARLLKAAYAPETPIASEDPALADALAERIQSASPREVESAAKTSEENGEEGGRRSGGGATRTRRSRRRRPGAEAGADPLGGDPRPEESAVEADADDDGEEER